MAYVISGKCIECGKCEKECPKGAIYPSCGQYVVIKRLCIECGRCAKVCPVGAPEPKKK
ncbi:MAG: 4Fe-4S dicluster domain-containing protein [Ruminococcaceae bacterium]|nr:4Fe-4S dicluster domain-containing protein [Oscillospiraceae bacterium]